MLKVRFLHVATDNFVEDLPDRAHLSERFESLIPSGVDNYQILCPMCGKEMYWIDFQNLFRCGTCYAKTSENGTILFLGGTESL